MIEVNDPKLTSWVPVEAGSDFPIQNLPFGVFQKDDHHPRVGVAIGNFVLPPDLEPGQWRWLGAGERARLGVSA